MSQARVLTDRELRKVLAYCSSQPHAERNRAMLLCTHLAGMRVGEVSALRICDVLAADGTVKDEIHLSASQTKGNKGRTVCVAQRLRDELTKYMHARFGIRNLLANNSIHVTKEKCDELQARRKPTQLAMNCSKVGYTDNDALDIVSCTIPHSFNLASVQKIVC